MGMFWALFNPKYGLRRKETLTFQEENKPKQPSSSKQLQEGRRCKKTLEGSPTDLG